MMILKKAGKGFTLRDDDQGFSPYYGALIQGALRGTVMWFPYGTFDVDQNTPEPSQNYLLDIWNWSFQDNPSAYGGKYLNGGYLID